MGFVKQAMVIGSGDNSIVTTEAFGMNGEYDIDALGGMMNFQLPYIPDNQKSGLVTEGVDITKLKKFDTVKLFYNEFTEDIDVSKAKSQEEIEGLGLKLIFDGFVDTIKLFKSKGDFSYTIGALTTIGLAHYRNLEYETKNGTVAFMVEFILKRSRLIDEDNPERSIRYESLLEKDTIPVKVDGGATAKEWLMQIREKHAVILHQGPDGVFRLSTASIFAEDATNLIYRFDFKDGTIFDLDYGDQTSNYNAVLVLGFPPTFGVSLDAIAVRNNQGNVNYFILENRGLRSNEDCEKVAREKLLELEKNFSVSFKCPLNPNFAIGQCFSINDYDKYTGEERFIIKKFAFNIGKADVSATLTGYTHSLTLLPQDIVLSNTGIADIDILELRQKIGDDIGWNNSFKE